MTRRTFLAGLAAALLTARSFLSPQVREVPPPEHPWEGQYIQVYPNGPTYRITEYKGSTLTIDRPLASPPSPRDTYLVIP